MWLYNSENKVNMMFNIFMPQLAHPVSIVDIGEIYLNMIHLFISSFLRRAE